MQTDGQMMKSRLCGEMRADQQNVVVGVCGRLQPRRGRAERAGSVDVLTPGVLVGGLVGAGPEAVGGARGATVDIAPEDDGAGSPATCKERPELAAAAMPLPI